MKASANSSPIYRWSAIALFFVIPLVLAVLGTLNFLDAAEIEAQAEQRERQLSLFRERAGAPERQQDLQLDFSRLYLDAVSPPLAGARLQERLSSLIATNGGQVIETGIIDAPGTGTSSTKARKIRARATFDVGNDGLLRLLHDLEAGLPIIEIGGLDVRPVGTGTDDDANAKRLRVDLSITGYMREPVS